MEIIRRAGLVAGLLLAIIFFFQAPPQLLEIAPVDFQKKFEKDKGRSTQSLADYIGKQTQDRLIEVQGADWVAFGERVDGVITQQSQPGDWQSRLAVGWKAGQALYFKPDEAPVNSIYSQLHLINKRSLLCYLAIPDAGSTRYLSVYTLDFSSFDDYAPAGVMYPNRSISVWFLLAGVAIYALIPWPRRSPESVDYPLRSHAITLDIGATILSGLFFAAPFFIIQGASSRGDIFDEGWIVLTLVFWFLALVSATLYVAAALNAAFFVDFLPDQMVVNDLLRRREYPYKGMVNYKPFIVKLPGWARIPVQVLMILLLLFRQINGALALGRLLSSENSGIKITMHDGTVARIWNNQLPEFDRITQVLDDHHITRASKGR